MKINIKNTLLILFALSVPLSVSLGQDKKSEKRIKVVLNDGTGARTVMDTTFTNCQVPDSVVLKNGKVIYMIIMAVTTASTMPNSIRCSMAMAGTATERGYGA